MKLGVKKGTVKLSDHQIQWQELFNQEKEILEAIFGQACLDIQHIGSTAIPNLIAKPLVDIAIKVFDLDNLDQIINKLNKVGYSEKIGRLPGRQKVFAKGKNPIVTHHLHVIEKSNPDWDYKIRFKEILIKYPNILNEYAELKKSLSSKYQNKRSKYTEGKGRFIKKTLESYA